MALFQVFNGDETALARVPFHEGYAYFCKDSGKFFIDVIIGDPPDNEHRIPLNGKAADGLMKEIGGSVQYLDAEDIATLDDVGDALEVAEKASSIAYSRTLLGNAWTDLGNETWSQSVRVTELQCGANHDIPPIVTPVTNVSEYSKIFNAVATPGTGIVFTTSREPANDIDIIIIDIG